MRTSPNNVKEIYQYASSILRASDKHANRFASAFGYMTAPERASHCIKMSVLLGYISGETAVRLLKYFKL